MQQHKNKQYERYELGNSPWVQNLTQKGLALLVGMTKTQLEALVRDKEKFTRRKELLIKTKYRKLAVPVGNLRTVHERLKFHLNKIKQPHYLFSPRKGRSQRDNAESCWAKSISANRHLSILPLYFERTYFLLAHHVCGLRSDVAGLFTHLVTIDRRMPFGSPISPVLTTQVHRAMFDSIYARYAEYNLKMSLWVDDLVISGLEIPGVLLDEIREIIRSNGLKSHKIEFRSGSRPVRIYWHSN